MGGDQVTFSVCYDDGSRGDHVLEASAYAWGPGAPWDSWCLLEEAHGTAEQPLTASCGAFISWMRQQAAASDVASPRWSSILSPSHKASLRAYAERWSALPADEKEPWMAEEATARPVAGSPDAGPAAGSPDAGPGAGSPDAGPDAGSPDAGPDAGSPDAGQAGKGQTPTTKARKNRCRLGKRQAKRGGVTSRKRESSGAPAPALIASLARRHRCKDGAMCRCGSPLPP